MLILTGEYTGTVLEARMEGIVTKEDMRKLIKTISVKRLQGKKIRLLFILINTEEITPRGLLEDVKIASFIQSVAKVAIVADNTLSDQNKATISRFIPIANMQHYSLEETELARSWLSE